MPKEGYCVLSEKDAPYWTNVTEMYMAQRQKGFKKYGLTLEENTACIEKRVAHLQEEMVDALMYCEWIKDYLKSAELNEKYSFEEYQLKAMRTMDKGQNIRSLVTQACLGMAGEVGEVCNLWEKHYSQGHSFVEIESLMLLELGDILWYLTLCCEVLGFSLADIAKANIAKLEKRYADSDNVTFSTEKSERRKDVDG